MALLPWQIGAFSPIVQLHRLIAGVGMGFCVVVSRLGTILAPYILLLGPAAPTIFGAAALLSGLAALLLPETLGTKMPDTLEDGEASPVWRPWAPPRQPEHAS